MSSRRLSALIDAIVAGRRPKRFRAAPEDVDIVRSAITLRAGRSGDAAPTEAFVEGLFKQLSEQATADTTPEIRPVRTRRVRTALVASAAAVALVAGTAAVTESLHSNGTNQVPQGTALRTGTFQTADGRVLGQVVAHRGHPSWVFMNVAIPNYEGRMTCVLQADNGTTVVVGAFNVHDGLGQWSKNVGAVDVGRLRDAKLVDATGSPVATATLGA
jgi:hypothetical protein